MGAGRGGKADAGESGFRARARELMEEVPRRWRVEVKEVLLTALVRVLMRWTGKKRHMIEIEGHGREENIKGVDLSRTVGWFTAVYPVVVEVEDEASLGGVMGAVKTEMRGVPGGGVGYGVLRHSGREEERERLRRVKPEVSFIEVGEFHDMQSWRGVVIGMAEEDRGTTEREGGKSRRGDGAGGRGGVG